MVIFSICVTILYLIIIGGFAIGFDKVKPFTLQDVLPKTQFSVVIPFRNEAENLPKLLQSVISLNYPKHLFEIIFVDDASQDNSVEIITKTLDSFQINFTIIKSIRTSNSPKKDAISSAINTAKYHWIVTTDADCSLPKFWLDSFDEFIQHNNPVCIVAPIIYEPKNSFLSRFQQLDILSLQGATVGSFGLGMPFLCNGANFAYSKAIFKELNGFEGNTNMASGDDIFLLEKITKHSPKKVHYLKCEKAIVTTTPQTSWSLLIHQRVRWAAKTSGYNNWVGKLTGLVVFLMNLSIIVLPILSLLNLFNIKIWVYILVIKLHIDFLLLYKTTTFVGNRSVFRSFLTSFFLYPFFTMYVVMRSVFKGYEWKGRSFKR